MKEVHLSNDVKKKEVRFECQNGFGNKHVYINECIIKICDIVDNRNRQ